MIPTYAWAVFTLVAAGAQTLRNAAQRELIGTLGTVGATHVRFLFGLPFALVFLCLVRAFSGLPLPLPGTVALVWILFGALAQIAATGLMLATMKARSFVVTTAYTKTEPLQVAVFAAAFLGEKPGLRLALAIGVATVGVMLMSWPRRGLEGAQSWQPALLGLVAGTFFAISAIGFRQGILVLPTPSFVVAASTTLVVGLCLQTILLSLYLAVFDSTTLRSIMRAWRPSLLAGFLGAFASQFWFLAFAITSAAAVRTLALVEMIFAQIVSRRAFRQKTSRRELVGMVLIAIAVVLLLQG
jgi:drug/metabolite transporter (DMT)-like permease